MIDKSYYKNMPAKNTLNDDNNIHTNDYYTSLEDIPLENMIINSNLENESIIKYSDNYRPILFVCKNKLIILETHTKPIASLNFSFKHFIT